MANPAIPILGHPPRVTMFIRGPNSTISETHWFANDNDVIGAVAAAVTLTGLRAALLGTDGQILLTRVSLDNIFRDSQVKDGTLNVPPTTNGPCDPRDRTLRLRLEGTSLYRKTLYLGLIPDGVIVSSHYSPGAIAGYEAAAIKYLNYLTGLGSGNARQWGFLVTTKNPLSAPVVKVKTAVAVAGVNITFTTQAVHALSVGDVVRVKACAVKAGFTPFLNGLFKVVTVPTGVSFTVSNKTAPTGTWVLVRGTAQRKLRVFQVYDDWFIRDIGFHKRGGRTFLPLGKLKTRR